MLSIYQHNHLLHTYQVHGPRLYPAMVEASRAHVVVLGETGALPPTRVKQLLAGLEGLRGPAELPVYDGTFEDTYYALEKNLAAQLGVGTADLDLQLARSRNDLDAGVFRMLLRDDVARILDALLHTVDTLLAAADRMREMTVVAYTHRRPAQPISAGHVLLGYADELLGQVRSWWDVLVRLNQSPLGASVIAGTDVPISTERLAALLGFGEVIPNAYAAVAGADHFTVLSSTSARSLGSGARLARVLQEWMSWGWIETPAEFCQGSTAMPQKRNPVVLEHMQSMAVAAVADCTAILGSIAASWWEDSNTATTDIQGRLWESNERTLRFFVMLARLFEVLREQTPPSPEDIVAMGTTTTAAAEALSLRGVPFRAAHGLLGELARSYEPRLWSADVVAGLASKRGLDLDSDSMDALLQALMSPHMVLERTQAEGPGREATRQQLDRYRVELGAVREKLSDYENQVELARGALDRAVDAVLNNPN